MKQHQAEADCLKLKVLTGTLKKKRMKEKAAKRREAERQQRIDLIIHAARKIFLEKGYLGATMRDIAKEAELSTGAIYFYFKGKDEIYGKICENIMQLTREVLKRGVKKTGRFSEKLVAIMKAYVFFYMNYRDDFDLLDAAFKQVTLPKDVNQKLDKMVVETLSMANNVFVEAIEAKELDENLDTWEMTIAVWAILEGMFSIHKRGFLADFDYNLDDLVEKQIRIFELGIKQINK